MINCAIVSVNVSTKRGTVKVPVDSIDLDPAYGIYGDAHQGTWHRQVSLLGIEDIEHMIRQGFQVKPGDFAENITTEGIKLYELPIGSIIVIGDTIIEVTQIGKECHSGCEIMKTTGSCVMPKRGIFGKVLRSGTISAKMNATVFEYEMSDPFSLNVQSYSKMVESDLFKEVYRTIAKRIVDTTNVQHGKVIDIGGGPGSLGIALAETTDMEVMIYDPLKECVNAAKNNICKLKKERKINVVQGCAENIVCKNDSFDLAVSRGSIFFWKNKAKGLFEIYRILKKNGWGYIGGGFGTEEMRKKVEAQRGPFSGKIKERTEKMGRSKEYFEKLLRVMNLNGSVESGNGGLWIILQK